MLPNGKRQILAFHTPGDIPDIQFLHPTEANVEHVAKNHDRGADEVSQTNAMRPLPSQTLKRSTVLANCFRTFVNMAFPWGAPPDRGTVSSGRRGGGAFPVSSPMLSSC